jgi:hypothetical protein
LTDRARSSKTGLLLELEELLRQRRAANETTVLIVDEAQSLPLELMEEIRLLTNIETNAEKLLTLVIAGQPEVAKLFTAHALRQLKQRIALRCELKPLDLRETAEYIAGRISVAGGEPVQMFTREAVQLIHERSRGIPRTINVIADNALVNGFAAQQRPVTTVLVREVCRDFDLAPPRVETPAASVPAIARTTRTVHLSESEQKSLDEAVALGTPTGAGRLPRWVAPALGAVGLKKP